METAENFMPILFKVLFGFIILNSIINIILLLVKRKRLYKLLALYWPAVLGVFMLQAIFQTGNLAVAMSFGISIFCTAIIAMVGFEAIGRRFPWKIYLPFYLACAPLTIFLHHLDYGFTIVALPFASVAAAPLFHTFLNILFIDRKRTTKLQKMLGVVFFMQAVHCINFAIFRMDPGAQLWGWLVAYAIYDMLAILLPSIALEEANMSENVRLQKLVNDRTADLNKSLKINEGLLKVLIHDIGNPLMVMRYYLDMLMTKDEKEISIIDKIKKSQQSVLNILSQIKELHRKNIGAAASVALNPVAIEECFNDLSLIFTPTLYKKNVRLKFNNQLAPGTKVMADKITLTHSVLSNLVSNGIKFSTPDSDIVITAREELNGVILEIKDEGPGISKETIQNVMHENVTMSTMGTSGEIGSGFGLSIVKSFVDSYGGQLEFDTNFMHARPDQTGTSVRITLDRA